VTSQVLAFRTNVYSVHMSLIIVPSRV